MQVVAEEAREAYPDAQLVELDSNSVAEMESNVDRIQQWVAEWARANGQP